MSVGRLQTNARVTHSPGSCHSLLMRDFRIPDASGQAHDPGFAKQAVAVLHLTWLAASCARPVASFQKAPCFCESTNHRLRQPPASPDLLTGRQSSLKH